MVRLLTERPNTKSKVKLGGFRSQLQVSYVSSHTEELWYNETVCLWMTIYIYTDNQKTTYCVIERICILILQIGFNHYLIDISYF